MHTQDEMLSVVAGYYAVKQASKREGRLQKLEACLARYFASFALLVETASLAPHKGCNAPCHSQVPYGERASYSAPSSRGY